MVCVLNPTICGILDTNRMKWDFEDLKKKMEFLIA